MRITHPNSQPGRQHALGVDFRDGVATVDSLHPERELALRQHGFTIEADPGVEAPFQAARGEEIIEILSRTSAPIPGAMLNADGTWTIEGEAIPEGTELVGPFATFERTDGTVIGDGTSLVTLDAADEVAETD